MCSGFDVVLGLARPEVAFLGNVHEQRLAPPFLGLVPVQDADCHRDAGAKEEVGGQADDGLEQVGLHDAPAYFPLGAAPEQDAVGHYHAHHALGVGHSQHMQQEGEVAPGLGRNRPVAVEAVVEVVGREVVSPVLQAEGRIGDDPGRRPAAALKGPSGPARR